MNDTGKVMMMIVMLMFLPQLMSIFGGAVSGFGATTYGGVAYAPMSRPIAYPQMKGYLPVRRR